MIVGILFVLALGVIGGRLGFMAGNAWAGDGGLEDVVPLFVTTAAGALGGIGIGLGIAYVLGRREER